MATSCDKYQLKLLLGRGNWLVRAKRNMFFERSINTWAFFFWSTSELIVCASLWKMVNFVLIFSDVDSSARTICSCSFQGTLSDFSLFFVNRILLAQHPKHNFETETKNMKNPYIEVLVDITVHNSLIFHSLFLLFCSSHAPSGSFKLTSPRCRKKDTT